ncbi:type II toxin-antitoxin system RelE/ParE family toxin [Streptomyces sp. NPDC048484]|uniref:type II toxin-antitoxin system RelE/ParE family toxin n=1 Tax=Streptomyces sp. NPDC048484 TaxID=3155146 RepID=UPI0034120690
MLHGHPAQLEIEPEARDWLELLPFRLYRRVEDKTDRLLGRPTTLGEPYSRHLGGKLRELRFELDGEAVRIPYWLAPGQRIVLLTVFRKTRMREAAEVERALQALKVCEAEHDRAEHTYDRRKES